MSKHTSGPWRAIDKRPIGCGGFAIFSDNHYIGFVGDSDENTNCSADARLIAAAPEMLSVLEEVAEALYCASEWEVPIMLPTRVKEAIAKAKGEK